MAHLLRLALVSPIVVGLCGDYGPEAKVVSDQTYDLVFPLRLIDGATTGANVGPGYVIDMPGIVTTPCLRGPEVGGRRWLMRSKLSAARSTSVSSSRNGLEVTEVLCPLARDTRGNWRSEEDQRSSLLLR
jgi:hypothetical protein